MGRVKFERKGGILIDRTRREHTTFIHPPAANATEDAVRSIKRGDYGAAVPLLSSADIARVRPHLLDAARSAQYLEPNLAQALGLLGGVEEVRILRQHIGNVSPSELGSRNEEEQLRLVFIAHALLRVRPSLLAARVLARAVERGTPWTREVTARLVSVHVLAGSTVGVERILLPTLRPLLAAEDACFAGALPVLLQRHFGEATARCKRLLSDGDQGVRRSLLLALVGCPYHGLPLLVEAFRRERQLDLRLLIARNIAPALPQGDIASLIRAALDAESPAIRLDAAYLLRHLDADVAREIARRRDPEEKVDRELGAFRKRVG